MLFVKVFSLIRLIHGIDRVIRNIFYFFSFSSSPNYAFVEGCSLIFMNCWSMAAGNVMSGCFLCVLRIFVGFVLDEYLSSTIGFLFLGMLTWFLIPLGRFNFRVRVRQRNLVYVGCKNPLLIDIDLTFRWWGSIRSSHLAVKYSIGSKICCWRSF